MNTTTKCPYCGLIHAFVCGMVKAMEYHPDGSIKRVEFKTAIDYPQQSPFPIMPVGSGSAGREGAAEIKGEFAKSNDPRAW